MFKSKVVKVLYNVILISLLINIKMFGQTFTTYTVESTTTSISSRDILAFAEDLQGNIWAATFGGGVSKFNGNAWTSYKANFGLEWDYSTSIAIDKLDNKWIGTEEGVLKLHANNSTLEKYTVADGLIDNVIKCIAVDNAGKIWFGTDKGISVYNDTIWTNYTKANKLTSNIINDIKVDSNNKVWIAAEGYIMTYDGTNWENFELEEDILTIAFEGENKIWFGTDDNSLYEFDGMIFNKRIVSDEKINNNIKSIAVDNTGNKWLVSESLGLLRFNNVDTVIFSEQNGIPEEYLSSVFVDKKNNKWLASYYGAYKYNNTAWTSYLPNGLCGYEIYAIVIDNNKNKWFGTEFGLSKFDGTTWTNYYKKDGLVDNLVEALVVDASNNIWIGTNKGVSKFNGTNWVTYTKKDGLVCDTINSITVDSQNNIWFGTENGISKLSGTTWTTYNESNSSLASNYVHDIKFDTKNNIWIATYDGINKWDGANNWVKYDIDKRPDATSVNKIVFDIDGSVWASTAYVLSKFDGVGWVSIKNDFEDDVQDIVIDSKGNKWVGTSDNGGLYKFDGSKWTLFNDQNGLMENTVYSLSVDQNNVIWIGGAFAVAKLTQENVVEAKALNINKSVINAPLTSFSESFVISSNTSWSISSNQSWISLSSYSGSNNSTITIVASSNTTTSVRIATITVSASDVATKTITITQAANIIVEPSFLSVSTTSISVPANDSGISNFNITSNCNWNIVCSESWLTINELTGSNSKTISFTYLKNSTPNVRTSTIAISGAGVTTQTITVTQAASGIIVIASLTVSTNQIILPTAASSSASFDISSNCSWMVFKSQTWVTINKTSGSSNATITINAQPNVTSKSRNATITIYSDQITEIVKITQPSITGINENMYAKINLYPNPANHVLYISDFEEINNVDIYDIRGVKVLNTKISNHSIDISELKNGVYFLRISLDDASVLRKFVKNDF